MTGFESKRMAAMEIEVAELKNSLAQAKHKKTLRDEFAMAALTGVITRSATYFGIEDFHKFAEWSYEVADAMMKERNK
jgi:hypothetical protein